MKNSKRRIVIGTNRLTGKLVYVNEDEFLEKHTHVLGIPGRGKSSFLEYLMRTFIKRGYGMCLIDPDYDLYKAMLKFAVDRRLEDRTILIDPNDDEWAVGLNLFEFDDEKTNVAVHVEEVRDELRLILGENVGEFKPVVDRWEANAFSLIATHKLSVVELMQFGDIKNPVFRHRLLDTTTVDLDPIVVDEWQRFDEEKATREQQLCMDTLLNRARYFASKPACHIFGQQQSTINFREAMDTGKVILTNLQTNRISEQAKRMLGVEILYKIWRAARGRSEEDKANRRPFFVFIDEFGSLVTPQMAQALDSLRKFGIYFILSHQRLGQLIRQDDDDLLSAVLADTILKFTFAVSVKDAEMIVPEIFSGQIHGDKVKLTLKHRAFAPRTEWVDIHSHTTSSAGGGGSGSGSGKGSAGGGSTIGSQLFKVGEGFFEMPVQVGASAGTTDSDSWQEHHSETENSFWTDSQAETTTRAPMTVYDEYEETSSVQFYNPDELERKFIGWVAGQQERQVYFSKKGHKPIPLITPDVEPIRVRKVDVEDFKKVVYGKYKRKTADVAKELEERRQQYKALPAPAEDATLSAVEAKLKERIEHGREPLIITAEVAQPAAETAAPPPKPKKATKKAEKVKKKAEPAKPDTDGNPYA